MQHSFAMFRRTAMNETPTHTHSVAIQNRCKIVCWYSGTYTATAICDTSQHTYSIQWLIANALKELEWSQDLYRPHKLAKSKNWQTKILHIHRSTAQRLHKRARMQTGTGNDGLRCHLHNDAHSTLTCHNKDDKHKSGCTKVCTVKLTKMRANTTENVISLCFCICGTRTWAPTDGRHDNAIWLVCAAAW